MLNVRVVLAAPDDGPQDQGLGVGLNLRSLLEAVANNNRRFLRRVQVPPLYESGVRYLFEPREQESVRDIAAVVARGGGDCAHLCAWRVAELREAGEPDAGFHLVWPKRPNSAGGYDYHIRVRRADGRSEDPSIALMRF